MKTSATLTEPRERLRRLREAAGLTQYELAKRAQMSRSLLWEIEAGTRGMTARSAQKLAAVLDVEPAELLPVATVAA